MPLQSALLDTKRLKFGLFVWISKKFVFYDTFSVLVCKKLITFFIYRRKLVLFMPTKAYFYLKMLKILLWESSSNSIVVNDLRYWAASYIWRLHMTSYSFYSIKIHRLKIQCLFTGLTENFDFCIEGSAKDCNRANFDFGCSASSGRKFENRGFFGFLEDTLSNLCLIFWHRDFEAIQIKHRHNKKNPIWTFSFVECVTKISLIGFWRNASIFALKISCFELLVKSVFHIV